MRILLTIANNAAGARAGLILLLVLISQSTARECTAGSGIVSNNIWMLSGKNDTLWMLSVNDRSFAFNMIAGKDAVAKPTEETNWWSYTTDCFSQGINELAFGGGYGIASLDTAPNVVWTFNHTTKAIRNVELSWPENLSKTYTVYDAVWASGAFYLAAQDGGMIRWYPTTDTMSVLFPGIDTPYDQSKLTSGSFPFDDSTRRVIGVDVLTEDSMLIITTPSRLYRYSVSASTWDTSIAMTFTDSDTGFKSVNRVFVNATSRSPVLYSTINVHLEKNDIDTTFLYKYNRLSRQWDLMLKTAPKSMTFSPNGCIYMLFNEERPGTELRNIAKLYHDTLGDSGTEENPAPVASANLQLSTRMTRNYDIDIPDDFNDILFIPRNDSTGYLWIATSEGLFLSASEKPGTDTASFILIKRAPKINDALKTTYARPGILTSWISNCKFIYNIGKSKDNVTIKIYDYNMDLVKTVIEKQPRISGKNGGPLGRSTVESEDQWDGKNARGHPCAPGVYYYKITTDSGERSFGKIVIAR